MGKTGKKLMGMDVKVLRIPDLFFHLPADVSKQQWLRKEKFLNQWLELRNK